MKKLFKLTEHDTTIRRELAAGLTTFCAMAYIIFLNPVFLSATGMHADGVLVATCAAAGISCLLCAALSNKPFALAPGMGMNAFFAYTLCGTYGYSWQQALAITLIAGLLFLLVVLSPLRQTILHAVPKNLKYAISAGIGLFITVIGLLDAGIVTMNTGVPALGDFSAPEVQTALLGLLITILLTVAGIRGSLILGMLLTALLGLLLGHTALPQQIAQVPTAISTVFMQLDFNGLLSNHSPAAWISLISLILSMTLVDFFDTLGFLIGTGARADLLDKTGDLAGMDRVLIADAAATVLGALCGTSTVTAYAESAAGIAAGGKTGLTALTTGLLFLLAAFFAPLTGVMTSAVTAPVLIIVGMYLVMEIKKVDFSHADDAIPAFLTLIIMPTAYSITAGIAAGFISHAVCKLTAKKWQELSAPAIVLAVIFLLYFFL